MKLDRIKSKVSEDSSFIGGEIKYVHDLNDIHKNIELLYEERNSLIEKGKQKLRNIVFEEVDWTNINVKKKSDDRSCYYLVKNEKGLCEYIYKLLSNNPNFCDLGCGPYRLENSTEGPIYGIEVSGVTEFFTTQIYLKARKNDSYFDEYLEKTKKELGFNVVNNDSN